MKFAVLTAAELRLVDVLLQRGVFPDPPASIIRRDLRAAAPADTTPRGFPHLRQRIPEIMAMSGPVGGNLVHGSMSELLRILARSPGRD